MLCQLVLVLVLALALLYGVGAESEQGKLSGDGLIQVACNGTGKEESECITTLQSATPDHKASANALALFTLGFVENHAENITAGIRKISAMPDVAPLLQSALTDCMEQYTSLDDLIEDATQAVQSNNYPDALKFVTASLSGLHLCDSKLQDSNFEEQAENKTGEDFQMAKDLTKYNILHKILLSAALNILKLE